jgi:hypothetical protein
LEGLLTGEDGAYIEDGLALDEVVDDSYEPGGVIVLAILLISSAAVVLASLPAAVGLGLPPARVVQLGVGFVSLAAVTGGVLGAVRLGVVARRGSHRLFGRRPARFDATTAD